jgi:hypothetical protein
VLRQIGSQQWAVTILLADSMPACAGSAGYWLETTPPNTATASPGSPSPDGQPTLTPTASPGSPSPGGKPTVTSAGSSCQVTVTFTGLQGIPTTAALVLDQSGTLSVISLTVSRDVGLSLYLLIPIITGFVLALITAFWALLRVRACFGLPAQPGGRARGLFDHDMLHHPILASGAWTLGDSWATNISTGVVVLTSVFGVTSATSTLFPGVALDRFAIVNVAAGIIVSFAPLIFGIWYVWYTGNNPGPSADATVMLPMAVRLSAPAEPTVPAGTTVRWRHRVRTVRPRQLTRNDLVSNTLIGMPRGGSVKLASKTPATLPAGATVTLRSPDRNLPPGPIQVQLPRGADRVQLPGKVALALTGLAEVMLLPTGAEDCQLPPNTVVTLPNGRATVLIGARRADVPSGALVTLAESDDGTLPTEASVTLTDHFIVTLGQARSEDVRLPPKTEATLQLPARSELCALTPPEDAGGQVVQITVVSGAAITVLAGATIAWQRDKNDDKKWTSAAVQAGKTIQVSAGSQVFIPAGVAIALPGGSDIPVPAGTAISIGGKQGTLAVAGGDLVPPPKSGNSSSAKAQAQPPDLMVPSPACISVPGGAKITVTGTADIKIPAGTMITPPHYRQATVPTPRDLQVPQASYVLTGNLVMILVAAFVTMLGIGAEFGIAGVLAFGMSEASQFWRSVMLAVIVAAGLGVLYYAVTAIAALADPQPGSSLSAKSGTSFTL